MEHAREARYKFHHRPYLEIDRSFLQPDRRVIRAARSLHVNRERRVQVEGRIDRAEASLRSYLELAGLEAATIGGYQVERCGEELALTPIALLGVTQLVLPETPGVHAIAEAAPVRAYHAAPRPAARTHPDTPPVAQVSFLAPDEAAFMHELRQLTARATTIYDNTRPIATPPESGISLTSAGEVYAYLRAAMAELPQEQLRVLTMTMKNQLLGEYLLYQGTLTASIIRVAEVFRPAIIDHAAGIIVAHNHPSGDPTPSGHDLATTRQLAQAGDLFDITLLDHVIIGSRGFVSMGDHGLVPARR